MDVTKMLVELRQEKDEIGEAILSLERLASRRCKPRGTPLSGIVEVHKRGRPLGSKNKPKAEPSPVPYA